MGVSSNLEVFLSEKHLNDHKEDREFITTILTTTPAMEQTNNDQEDECHASTKQDLVHELIKTTKQQPVQEQRYHDEQGKEGHHHQVITQQEKQQQSMGDDHDDDKNAPVPPVVAVLPPSTAAPLGLTKLKIPPLYKEEETEKKEGSNDDEEDGFKTPTSPEHRIPAMLQCPPAPRKPKTTSSSTTKRKGCSCRARVVLDFSEGIESLFPTPFAADLGGDTGGNNKKVKLKLFAEPQ